MSSDAGFGYYYGIAFPFELVIPVPELLVGREAQAHFMAWYGVYKLFGLGEHLVRHAEQEHCMAPDVVDSHPVGFRFRQAPAATVALLPAAVVYSGIEIYSADGALHNRIITGIDLEY